LLRIPLSTYALLTAMVFVATVRMSDVKKYETTWDIFGYYLYLPAIFIEGDPMMNDRSWVEEMNTNERFTETVYQVAETEQKEPMYFFLMGMAIFYLPFFLIGHAIAWMTGSPMDAVSAPYQYSLVAGGVIYTILGLWLFRKILLRFFSERLTAALLIIVVFGTNYSQHMTYKNLETVNVLFLLMCWLIWSTLRWHEEHKFRQILQIGVSITLMALVKPSEVLALLVPLLWSVYSIETLKQKLRLLFGYRAQLLKALAICFLIASPQMLYWFVKTGHFFYDSYKNPGIGLDLWHPHLWQVLFSAKKGWLVYTPVMVLGLIGFYYFLKKNKSAGFGLLIYFCITFYIISSWTEWWYGGSFSCRPVITSYPILALAMGMFFQHLQSQWARWCAGIFAVLCIALNQFQWWQMRNEIIDLFRTTPAYYRAIFLQTEVPYGADTLKSIERSFKLEQEWYDRGKYVLIGKTEVIKQPEWSNEEFQCSYRKPYGELTERDHVWMEIELDYEKQDSTFSYGPFVVATALYKEDSYNYRGPALAEITTDKGNGKFHARYAYLTPHIRTNDDIITTYIWNPGKNKLKITSYTVKIYSRKD